MFGLSSNSCNVRKHWWLVESVVVGRVDVGNDANSTSDFGTESGFLCCVGITRLEAPSYDMSKSEMSGHVAPSFYMICMPLFCMQVAYRRL